MMVTVKIVDKILKQLELQKFNPHKSRASDEEFEKWVRNYLVKKTKLKLGELADFLTAEQIVSIKEQLKDDWRIKYNLKGNKYSYIVFQPFGKSHHPDVLVVLKGVFIPIECKYSKSKSPKPRFNLTIPKGGVKFMFYNGKRHELITTLGRDIQHPEKDAEFNLLRAQGAHPNILKEYLKNKRYYYGNQEVGYNMRYIVNFDVTREIRKQKVK